MSVIYNVPKQSLLGQNAIHQLMTVLSSMSVKKALIVTDKGLIQAGVVQTVTALLDEQQLEYCIFDDVQPNPTVDQVMAGKSAFLDNNCDYLIALGGGSPIDTAKAINVVAHNPGCITDYEVGKKTIGQPLCKLVAVATTAGTASEATVFSVITNVEKKVKFLVADPVLMADIAVVDPMLMLGLPKMTTACTGMDALTHAIEAYVSKLANPVTDSNAIAAIKMIFEWLPKATHEGDNVQAREMMGYGQYLAGLAFSTAGVGLVHSMAHQIGATHDLPHGLCNAVILPYVCRFNAEHSTQAQAKLAALAREMSLAEVNDTNNIAANKLISAIEELSSKVEVPRSFSTFGFTDDDIESWIEPTLADPCTTFNPVEPTAKQVNELYTLVV